MKRIGIYQHLNLLSEPLRARLLHLLQHEELGVGELSRIVQVPQSTVSRHLKALTVGGWVTRREAGTSTWLRMATENLSLETEELWRVVSDSQTHASVFAEDQERLESVVAARQIDSADFFGRVAAEWDTLRRALFGEGFILPSLLSLLPCGWSVGDLGCGTGVVSELLAPVVSRVIAVDREAAMLERAGRRLNGLGNVELRQGDLTTLPIADGELDATMCVLVLHHVAEPAHALAEMRRVLRPGGRAVIVDMKAHKRAVYKQTMGHRHLGFGQAALRELAAEAGMTLDHYRTLPTEADAQGPPLFVATFRAAAVAR